MKLKSYAQRRTIWVLIGLLASFLLVVLIGSLLTSLAQPSQFLPNLFFFFKLTFFYLLLLILPGYLLTNLLSRTEDWTYLEKISLSLGLSIVLLVVPGVLAYLSRLPINWLMISYLALTAVLLGCNLYKKRQPHKQDTGSQRPPLGASYKTLAILLIFIITLSLLSLYVGAFDVSEPKSDGPYHRGFINKLVVNPRVSPYNAFYKVKLMSTQYGYSIYYLLLAILVRMTGAETVVVWYYLPFLLAPLPILAIYCLGKTWFQNETAALTVTSVFLFFEGAHRALHIWRQFPLPNQITMWIIFPAALLCIFKYFSTGHRRFLATTGLLGLALSTTHIVVFAILLFSLVYFLALSLTIKAKYKGILRKTCEVIGVIILMSLLYLALRFLPYLQWSKTGLTSTYTPLLFKKGMIIYGGKLIAKHPKVLWQWSVIPCYFIIVAFMKDLRKKPWKSFVVASLIVTYLVLINPLLVTPISRVMPLAAFNRTIYLAALAIYFILGYGLFRSTTFVESKAAFLRQRLARNSLLALAILTLLGTITCPAVVTIYSPWVSPYFRAPLKHKPAGIAPREMVHSVRSRLEYHANFLTHQGPQDSLKPIKKYIPANSVVLSDADTSYHLPTYINAYVVAVPQRHDPVGDKDHSGPGKESPAELEIKEALDPKTDLNRTTEILKKYRVDLVLINTSRISKEGLDKFRNSPILFQEIFSSSTKQLFLFSINRQRISY